MESRNVCSQDEPYISHHFLLLSRHVYLFVFVFGGLCTVSGGVYVPMNVATVGAQVINRPNERLYVFTQKCSSQTISPTLSTYIASCKK